MLYQSKESVGIEDKVGLVGVNIPDDGVHTSGLEIAGHNFQIVVDTTQIWLLQLHTYVLCYEVDRNYIFIPAWHGNLIQVYL